MVKNFRFVFVQRTFGSENLEFIVFQKGKILPVATIEVTPLTVNISCFDEEKKDMSEIQKAFQKFSGCKIKANSFHTDKKETAGIKRTIQQVTKCNA